jgi:hypothetical protein
MGGQWFLLKQLFDYGHQQTCFTTESARTRGPEKTQMSFLTSRMHLFATLFGEVFGGFSFNFRDGALLGSRLLFAIYRVSMQLNAAVNCCFHILLSVRAGSEGSSQGHAR